MGSLEAIWRFPGASRLRQLEGREKAQWKILLRETNQVSVALFLSLSLCLFVSSSLTLSLSIPHSRHREGDPPHATRKDTHQSGSLREPSLHLASLYIRWSGHRCLFPQKPFQHVPTRGLPSISLSSFSHRQRFAPGVGPCVPLLHSCISSSIAFLSPNTVNRLSLRSDAIRRSRHLHSIHCWVSSLVRSPQGTAVIAGSIGGCSASPVRSPPSFRAGPWLFGSSPGFRSPLFPSDGCTPGLSGLRTP